MVRVKLIFSGNTSCFRFFFFFFILRISSRRTEVDLLSRNVTISFVKIKRSQPCTTFRFILAFLNREQRSNATPVAYFWMDMMNEREIEYTGAKICFTIRARSSKCEIFLVKRVCCEQIVYGSLHLVARNIILLQSPFFD